MMENGQLVPIEITMELLKLAMTEAAHKFFLIDGFPRSVDQAKVFDTKVLITLCTGLECVLYLALRWVYQAPS